MRDLAEIRVENEGFSREGLEGEHPLRQPAYTWSWNGPIDRAEIVRQLDDMVQAGIRCVYVLCFPKNFRSYTRNLHPQAEYLSEEYLALIRYATERALERGVQVWLYDEGGWPSGSACGQVTEKRPELCRKSLEAREICLAAGDVYAPGAEALAAFDENGRVFRPGRAADGDARLIEYFARWEEGLTVDSLDAELGREFVKNTHEKYTRALSGLLGEPDAPGSGRVQIMFTDEPGAGRFPWPRGFAAAFRARFGYDLIPYLPALLNLDEDAAGPAVQARMDYRQLTGEMFRDNFFRPIRSWCRRSRVLSGGHLDQDHITDGCLYHSLGSVLPLLREMDVPGVDVIWRQIAPPRPDRPPCAEGNGFFPRFASSAAAQSGGKLALSESLAVYGAGVTGDEIRFALDFQLARGINLFNFMHMPACRQRAAALVERPAIIPEAPGYFHLRAINDYAQRACWLMGLGAPGADTALYFPARDIWAGGRAREEAIRAFEAAGRTMEEKQVDFDIIDDEGLRLARREGDALCLGLARYGHVVVPACRYMPEDVADILRGVDGSVCPALDCANPAIRARSRRLPEGGRVWMLFNESAETVETAPPFPHAALCRIDADRGRLTRLARPWKLTFAPGQAMFFLSGRAAPDWAEEPKERKPLLEIRDFTLRTVRRATIRPEGIFAEAAESEELPCRLGPWEKYVGGEFSGLAVYRARAALPETPRPGERYEIDLGHVEISAGVRINGQEAGVVWRHPARVEVDGAAFGGERAFTLEIEVANTLVNQLEAALLDSWFSPEEIGPYQARQSEFERDAPRGGLYGPVAVSRMT